MPISAHRLRLEHFQRTLCRTARRLEKTRRDFAEGGEQRYKAVGSIPLFRMASEARAEARLFDQPFCPLDFSRAGHNGCGKRLNKLNFRGDVACEIDARGVGDFAGRHHGNIRAARGDHIGCIATAWPDFDADPFGDAELGKKIGPEPNAAGATRDRDGSGLEQDLFEGIDGAHVGFLPVRTATPIGARARSKSVPATIRLATSNSWRPSLDRITTSAGTPRASCAAIVCGPVPCDAPDPVVTLMPLACSKPGKSCSYAPVNPLDIRTFNRVNAVTRHDIAQRDWRARRFS
jgi:hypothetical protein